MATSKFSKNVSAPSICDRAGDRIRELRRSKGWSQRMLADHAQIEYAHLARLELGQKEAGLLILQKIADALEVQVWELLR
jgi:transcriptional regulator with XRE-family HTH domain